MNSDGTLEREPDREPRLRLPSDRYILFALAPILSCKIFSYNNGLLLEDYKTLLSDDHVKTTFADRNTHVDKTGDTFA